MRRLFSALFAASALLAFTASPASAFTSEDQPPGPPLFTGGPGAVVLHCNSETLGGDRGVIVSNKNKIDVNNCGGF